jgi:release factor glutamine methyltransferase
VTIKEALLYGRRRLAAAGIQNPVLDSELILAHVLGLNRLQVIVDNKKELTGKQLALYERLLDLRRRHVPVAYITGRKEFYGLEFFVRPGVLIPRPETEFSVEEALQAIKDLRNPRVADLCCGSGAIAVTLAVKSPGLVVYASDISETAVEVTRENAVKHRVEERVFFMRGDLWEPFEKKGIGDLDAVVSNPPYIPSGEIETLPEDVKREPVMALDGGPDGLEIYRRIISKAPAFLKAGGRIIFEIGWNQAAPVKALLEKAGFEVKKVIKDYAGLDRVVSAVKKREL